MFLNNNNNNKYIIIVNRLARYIHIVCGLARYIHIVNGLARYVHIVGYQFQIGQNCVTSTTGQKESGIYSIVCRETAAEKAIVSILVQ